MLASWPRQESKKDDKSSCRLWEIYQPGLFIDIPPRRDDILSQGEMETGDVDSACSIL